MPEILGPGEASRGGPPDEDPPLQPTARTLADFEAFFQEKIAPELARLKAERPPSKSPRNFFVGFLMLIMIMFGIWLAALFLILWIPCFILWALLSFSWEGLAIAIALGLVECGAWWWIKRKWAARFDYEAHVKRYKENVVRPIVRFVHPGLSYDPSPPSVDLSLDIQRSRLITENDAPGGTEDIIRGTIGRTRLLAAELKPGGKTKRPWGLLVRADFNKSFKGMTFVLPEMPLASLMLPKECALTRLDNPEFERHFAVYTTDPSEARYILSPRLMERLLDYRNKLPADYLKGDVVYFVSFSFIESQVFAAIQKDGDLFEPDGEYDFQEALKVFSDVHLIAGIVEELDLNTRLWSKD